jgi:hypothetical protein
MIMLSVTGTAMHKVLGNVLFGAEAAIPGIKNVRWSLQRIRAVYHTSKASLFIS